MNSTYTSDTVTKIWKDAINDPISKENMELLLKNYPADLISTFSELLLIRKENLATLLQKEHARDLQKLKNQIRTQLQIAQANSLQEIKYKYEYWYEVLKKLNVAKMKYVNSGTECLDEESQMRLLDLKMHMEADIGQLNEENKKLTEEGDALSTKVKVAYDRCKEVEKKKVRYTEDTEFTKTKLKDEVENLRQKVADKLNDVQKARHDLKFVTL